MATNSLDRKASKFICKAPLITKLSQMGRSRHISRLTGTYVFGLSFLQRGIRMSGAVDTASVDVVMGVHQEGDGLAWLPGLAGRPSHSVDARMVCMEHLPEDSAADDGS